jgi:hypothetical protein
MPWDVWRVWLSGYATLKEIETEWTLCQLMDANEALDIKQELEAEAAEEARNKAGAGAK